LANLTTEDVSTVQSQVDMPAFNPHRSRILDMLGAEPLDVSAIAVPVNPDLERVRKLYIEGKKSEAFSMLERLESVATDDYGVWGTAFALRLDAGDLDGAAEAVEQMMLMQPNSADSQAATAVIKLHRGQVQEAISHLEAVLEVAPNSLLSLVTLADIYRQNWHVQRAGTLYLQIYRAHGLSARTLEAHLQWAAMLLDFGNLELSHQILERIRAQPRLLDGRSNERWTLLAVQRALAAGLPEAAGDLLESHDAWSSSNADEVKLLQARQLWSMEASSTSRQTLTDLMEHPELGLRARKALVESYMVTKDYDKSVALLREGLQKSSRYTHLQYLDRLASALRLLGDAGAAEVVFQEVAASHGEEPFYWLMWADFLVQEKDYIAASGVLVKALQRHPQHAQLNYLAGISKVFEGDEVAARGFFQASVILDPDNARAWISLAKLKHGGHGKDGVGRHKNTIEVYEEALRKSPGNPSILTELGRIAMEENRIENAIIHFRQALAGASGDPVAASELAVLLAHQKGGMVEAEAVINRALLVEPNHVVTLFAKGRILLLNAHYGEAARVLDAANRSRPVHGHSLAYAASAYLKAGEMSLARDRAIGALKRLLRYEERIMAHEVLMATDGMETASAMIHRIDVSGVKEVIGEIQFRDLDDGLELKVKVAGLQPGLSGFHVHNGSSCEAGLEGNKVVSGLAAEAHLGSDLSPAAQGGDSSSHGGEHRIHHGLDGSALPIGDLPPLKVNDAGYASTTLQAPRLRVAIVRDHAVIVHSSLDGGRFACGIIRASAMKQLGG